MNWKKARAQEHQERKQWIKRQAVYHTHGSDDDEDEDKGTDKDSSSVITSKRTGTRSTQKNVNVGLQNITVPPITCVL